MIVEQGPRMQASLSGNQRNPGAAFNAFSSLIFSFDTIDLTLPWTSLRVKWESRDLVWMVVGLPRWLSGTESACQAGDGGLIPGLERSPGEGNGYPLQCSCLENPIEEPGGLLFMGLHRVGHDWSDLAAAAASILAWKISWTKEPGRLSRTQLSDWTTTTTTWMVVMCCVISRFSHVQLWPYGLMPARLLCLEILQAWILEWVAMPSLLQGIFSTQDWTRISYVSCIGRSSLPASGFFTTSHLRRPPCQFQR